MPALSSELRRQLENVCVAARDIAEAAARSTLQKRADDSLGWVYQFWQTKRKDEVNKSGDKIDGRTLSAVTQLFTEDYMVQFLLHNTIEAWWAGKRFSIFDFRFPIRSEEDARRAVSLAGVQWEYLRFIRDDADADPSNPKSEIQNPKSPFSPRRARLTVGRRRCASSRCSTRAAAAGISW